MKKRARAKSWRCNGKSEKRPSYSSGNNAISLRSGSEFRDSETWDEMFQKHLGRYNPPNWSTICDPDIMSLWLDRLNLDEDKYFSQTNTTLSDFISLNPGWPLRAWLGTVLEYISNR